MRKKVFISYSRRNTDFAEKLALELQGAGADVWFDQHNIKAGSAWDSSIDAAIDSCDILLLVCSKAAVASENVLDEVGFALSEKKTVVPVLIEPCKLPFRVKRLTSYDLSKDLTAGMTALLGALHLDKPHPQTDWTHLEQLKNETTNARKLAITAEKKWWLAHRKRSLLAIVLFAIPILTDQFQTINISGMLGLWFYLLVVLLAMLITSGLRELLERYAWGKRFVMRHGDVFVPGLLVLFAIFDSTNREFTTTPLFFLLLFFLVVSLPDNRKLTSHVDYFINLIGLILFMVFILLDAHLGSGSFLLLPSVNMAFLIALAGSFLFGLAVRKKPGSLKGLGSYARVSFFYLFIGMNLILDAVQYGSYTRFPLYLLMLCIGHVIGQMARKTEWNLKVETVV